MYAQRLSFIVVSTLVSLGGIAHAQGPWPTMNRPSFYSPVQEFFTPRSYSVYAPQPQFSQYPSTPIIPGVPQCANGRCRPACPNGQCSPRSQCANGQCSNSTQSNFPPVINSPMNCVNGVCRSHSTCPNGQCGNRIGRMEGASGFWGTQPMGQPNSSIGFRPLTPIPSNEEVQPRRGQLNRLVPLNGGLAPRSGVNLPQGPMFRDRESMIAPEQDYANDPTIRLR